MTDYFLAFSLLVSFSMIVLLWYYHQKDSAAKKLFWSLVLCVPFIGWVFYGAFYTPLSENSIKAPPNRDAMYGGH
jgi:hypothetical protein